MNKDKSMWEVRRTLEQSLPNRNAFFWKEITIVSDEEIEIELDEYKIIQYWYEDFLDFLEEIAPFIEEGYIELSCPEYKEYGTIHFDKGKVWMELPNTEYERYETEDLRR